MAATCLKTPLNHDPEELIRRAVRFYQRYEPELESIRQLLHIQHNQMHYKVEEKLREQYDDLIVSLAERLAAEDRTTAAIRSLTLEQVGKQPQTGFRTK